MSLTGYGFSDYLETKILNFLKGTSMPAAPATVYIGLFTAQPADTGTTGGTADGTEVTTTNGTGGWSNYARQALTTATGWNAIAAATGDSTGQQITNNATIGGNTAWTNNGGSTVTITGVGIWDATTSGNLLIYINLVSSQALANGSAFSFAAGNLAVQVD